MCSLDLIVDATDKAADGTGLGVATTRLALAMLLGEQSGTRSAPKRTKLGFRTHQQLFFQLRPNSGSNARGLGLATNSETRNLALSRPNIQFFSQVNRSNTKSARIQMRVH